jgi:EAL domain-containing protein (putative c-di-GMP-specific phosphodiesterase class I)
MPLADAGPRQDREEYSMRTRRQPAATAVVIDDMTEMAQFLCDLCAAQGFEARAFASVRNIDPAVLRDAGVILLDLNLPDVDGVEFMRALAGARVAAPVVLVSGFDACTLEAAANAGREAGLNIQGILRKPFSLPQFERVLSAVPPAAGARVLPELLDGSLVAQAIEENRIEPYFQPKIDLNDFEIVGFEALARLRLASGELVLPDRFLDSAAEAGLMNALTDRMLVLALDAWRDWSGKGLDCTVSVNVPASRLQDVRFPDRLEELYGLWNIDRSKLILELTETETLDHYSNAMDTITRLSMKRVRLAIDDFGTGFSSLMQLKHLPCQELKIDRSFTEGIDRDAQCEVIVRKCIELGGELGLTVTAEGIENQQQADMLRLMGCDLGQGFFFSRPENRADINSSYIEGFAA